MIDALLALPDHVVLTLIVLVLVNVGLYVVAWTNDQKQKKTDTRAGRPVPFPRQRATAPPDRS